MNTINEAMLQQLQYDPMQILCGKVFRLPLPMLFTQIPTEEDPRGYADLYGNDIETIYTITGKEGEEIHFRALMCFYSSISFILDTVSGEVSMSVQPEQDGLHIFAYDEEGNLVNDKKLSPNADFLLYIYKKSRRSE